MNLSRKFLKSLQLTDEQIEAVIEVHAETVDAIKTERDELKDKAAKYEDMEKELAKVKADAEKANKDPYKVKYEALKEDFEAYKADIDKKATKSAKETAYRELLKRSGVSEKRLDAILRVTDIEALEIDDKGALKDEDAKAAEIRENWGDFIETTKQAGASVPTPPANVPQRKTKEEIMAIADRTERTREMAKNLDLFQ